MRKITILGSTGSIGVSTLDVIGRHPDRYRVYALTAQRSVDAMLQQCLQYRPEIAVMVDADAAEQLQARLSTQDCPTRVLSGRDSLDAVAAAPEVELVMASIVGAAGLESTLAAVTAGKQVLLANKESLVMAGDLMMAAAREHSALLLPIDSEHNAIFQCMPASDRAQPDKRGVSKILLTASGGPFRTWSVEQMRSATPDQACAHPNWSMGRKISVDSATLMNKGLELIEACWLFDVSPRQVEVVVHPQSIVHSMVQYEDGSVLAELGNPDMRTPIAYGLAWPERIGSGVAELDIVAASRLDFEAPDTTRFPCLELAGQAAQSRGVAAAVLNAANEVAVDAFLEGKLGFMDIARVNERVLEQSCNPEPESLAVVKQADADARELALAAIGEL